MKLPNNLIVLDEAGNVYYSAEPIIKNQDATIVDLWRNYTGAKVGMEQVKTFVATVTDIDDIEITIDTKSIKPLNLYEVQNQKGIPAKSNNEALGIIVNDLQKSGMKLNDFEIHQEKFKNDYYFVAFTRNDIPDWKIDLNHPNAKDKLVVEEVNDAIKEDDISLMIKLSSQYKIPIYSEPNEIGTGHTYKWRLDTNNKILIADHDDKDEFNRDGSDIAKNGKKVNHKRLFQERER